MRFASILFGIASAVLAQPATADLQAVQGLILEFRQLRQDLQITAATIQRVQIIMYRLQTQGEAVSRATQRRDMAHGECEQAASQRKWATHQIEELESAQRNQPAPDQKERAQVLANLRFNLEMFANQEQQCRPEEIESEGQLRAEQAKLSELQDQLDKLDRVLARAGETAGSRVAGVH